MEYILRGARQYGFRKDGEIPIERGDIIVRINPVGFWWKLKEFITGESYFYKKYSKSGKLFVIHRSIIERYFERV